MTKATDQIRAELMKQTADKTCQPASLLSTGSTLLNLACTGDHRGGFAKGMYFLLVGDSRSGKTFFSCTCLAEAAKNPEFKDYRFVFDDVEGGALMDFEKFFGQKMAKRLELIYSRTTEEFFFNLDDTLGHGRPCIYILDSMDALSSDAEQKKFDEKKAAHGKGTAAPGDYGDGKAKINSRYIRGVLGKLRDTGSILIVINQTRDNVGASPWEPQKTRSGGKAMTFYATIEAWLSVGRSVKKTVLGKERSVASTTRVAIHKNRITGKLRTVEVQINPSFGIDNLGSCVDFLLSESKASGWSKPSQTIKTVGLGFKTAMTREKLIREIEAKGLEEKLGEIVGRTWTKIEEACAEDRKPRYE